MELAFGIIAACLISYGPFVRRHDINEAPIATPSNMKLATSNMKLATQKAKAKEKELDTLSSRTDSALDYYAETPRMERARTIRVDQNMKLNKETTKNYGVPTGVKYDKYGQRLGFMDDAPVKYDKYGQRIEKENKAAAVLGAENTAAIRAPTVASSKNSDTMWFSSSSDNNSGAMSPGRAISTIGSVSIPAPSITSRSVSPSRPSTSDSAPLPPPVSIFSSSITTGSGSTPSLPLQTSPSTSASVKQFRQPVAGRNSPAPQLSSEASSSQTTLPSSQSNSPQPGLSLSRTSSPRPGTAQGSSSPPRFDVPSRPGTAQSHRSVQSNLRREATVIGSSNGSIGTGIRLADGQQPQNLGLGINIGATHTADGYKVNDPDRPSSSRPSEPEPKASPAVVKRDESRLESREWDNRRFEELMNKELTGENQAATREKLGLKSPMVAFGSQDAKRRQEVMMGLR